MVLSVDTQRLLELSTAPLAAVAAEFPGGNSSFLQVCICHPLGTLGACESVPRNCICIHMHWGIMSHQIQL